MGSEWTRIDQRHHQLGVAGGEEDQDQQVQPDHIFSLHRVSCQTLGRQSTLSGRPVSVESLPFPENPEAPPRLSSPLGGPDRLSPSEFADEERCRGKSSRDCPHRFCPVGRSHPRFAGRVY